jgi:lysozyme
MPKQVSPKGIAFIEKEEGVVLHVYADPIGIITGGTGHVLTVTERRRFKVGDPVTQELNDLWLEQDLRKALNTIDEKVTVHLTQNQIDALASFIFNVGTENFKGSTLLKKTQQIRLRRCGGRISKMESRRPSGIGRPHQEAASRT